MNSTAERVGWATEPNGRGTLGLLVSCGTTIFLCTYSAVHPDLPRFGDSKWTIFWQQMKQLILCICAPEAYAFVAAADTVLVRGLKKRTRLEMPGSRSSWSLKQCFFAYMGGYVVQTDSTTVQDFYIEDLLELIQTDVVEMPTLTDEDIDDRSKASWITKTIALLQVAWFLAQLLARAVQHISITTLELFTLGIVSCSIVTYAFNWEKPFDVRRPVILKAKRNDYPWPTRMRQPTLFGTDLDIPLPSTVNFQLLFLIIPLFAVPHLLGWNFSYTSVFEQWVWRVGSILCAAIPGLLILSFYYYRANEHGLSAISAVSALIFLYMAVRAALFVEMFVALRSVPVDAYQTPRWSDYFPAFGT